MNTEQEQLQVLLYKDKGNGRKIIDKKIARRKDVSSGQLVDYICIGVTSIDCTHGTRY